MAQWVIEGIKDGAYYMVTRWSPEEGPMRAIGLLMRKDLAKVKLPAKDIY